MMTVTISTLEGAVERIEIINQGHPVRGGWPEDDDLRTYRWRTEGPKREGHVEHRRDDGALRLVQLVIDDLIL